MDVLLLVVSVFFGYILMYRFYGKFLSNKIFNLDDKAKTPAVQFEDGIDFVPTRNRTNCGSGDCGYLGLAAGNSLGVYRFGCNGCGA